MKIRHIVTLLDAKVFCCEDRLDTEVHAGCGCDMMSDVLAFVKDQGVLITGLSNSQVIRTANMMDMVCIVFVRSKTPTDEMIALADECGITVMRSTLRAYEACGLLYTAGLGNDPSRKEAAHV